MGTIDFGRLVIVIVVVICVFLIMKYMLRNVEVKQVYKFGLFVIVTMIIIHMMTFIVKCEGNLYISLIALELLAVAVILFAFRKHLNIRKTVIIFCVFSVCVTLVCTYAMLKKGVLFL